ncbi:MAG TPA: hypothetical protein VLY82_03195 [Nitrososphaerales archaeon]|nr:hypothetical protein [Nitrososphaerales archaeon]
MSLRKVTIWIPRYAHRALKEESAHREMTMGNIILEALEHRIVFFERGSLKDKGEVQNG